MKTKRTESNEALAMACHCAWYAYTVLGLGEEGDVWSKAPQWQKDSILNGVEFWNKQLLYLAEGTAIHEAIAALAPLSHENWMELKEKEGWTYGPTKDPSNKQHPCMVPYADLPADQKKKDEVVLQAYLTFLGF